MYTWECNVLVLTTAGGELVMWDMKKSDTNEASLKVKEGGEG